MVESYEPPLKFPEFNVRLNVKANKRKSVFIADDGKMSVQDALAIAKEQACKMGMGDKELLVVLDAPYSAKEKGWCVIVQNRF